jgi:hypothetical protein
MDGGCSWAVIMLSCRNPAIAVQHGGPAHTLPEQDYRVAAAEGCWLQLQWGTHQSRLLFAGVEAVEDFSQYSTLAQYSAKFAAELPPPSALFVAPAVAVEAAAE